MLSQGKANTGVFNNKKSDLESTNELQCNYCPIIWSFIKNKQTKQ